MIRVKHKRKPVASVGPFELLDLEEFPHDGIDLESEGARLRGLLFDALQRADVTASEEEFYGFVVVKQDKRKPLALVFLYDLEIFAALRNEIELLASTFVLQISPKPEGLGEKILEVLKGLVLEPLVDGRPSRKIKLRTVPLFSKAVSR